MKKFLSILLSCVFIFALIGCGGDSEVDKAKKAERDKRTTIITTAQSVVEENLKSPGTAKVNVYNIKETNSDNENMTVYNVSGYVDAENSFGAKLRSNFIVRLEGTKDLSKYEVLDVKIE
ncbi:hypothetical protein OR62_10970 [Clostridium tetani]|uniref:Lipoprotein n=1 Tax=Clostridium tetani TaxID=1513 RepID=A0ABY0EPW7_CLOTA|nr:hypothetical protein [Clostridium tetani]KHO37550.1 hypothetical protein OR62_10970 [Clostridium tetani]RXI56932.1 hypothetical protein DP131_06440 [Clostridium tetani]RXI74584.1 hypothetical protein DQN76_00140 [Clostridium tetani]